MKKIKMFVLNIILSGFFLNSFWILSGCGVVIPIKYSEKKLSYLQIGMTKDEVIGKLGYPDIVRAGSLDENGRPILGHQYELYKRSTPWFNVLLGPFFLTLPWWWPSYLDLGRGNFIRTYWLTYVDDKLVQWGMAGDWQPNLKQEIKIIK